MLIQTKIFKDIETLNKWLKDNDGLIHVLNIKHTTSINKSVIYTDYFVVYEVKNL